MKTAKIGALFLVSVLALAGVTAGYALWSENLYIDGTVSTGDVDIEWSLEAAWDSETEGKDVSSIEATIDGDTLYVSIYGAYPGMDYWVHFDIHSLGSVPVHFTDFYLEGDINPEWITITPDEGYLPITGIQLHQGDSWWGTLNINLDDTAEELTTYYFEYSINAYQYNG